ncbi:hypothetical protein HYV80_04860 [Candidatus Woesearchaeota archaeon]|nr:hypothetical protein [Candidatus Woesearchaeota archaeon]
MDQEEPPFEPPFVPFPDCNTPEIDLETAETPDRADLKELPLETVIQFYGYHPASRYTAKLTQDEAGRRVIKIWFAHNLPCAIGPIENIRSSEGLTGEGLERGVMQIGKNYDLPTFAYHGKEFKELGLSLDWRCEPYTKIYVQRPTK